MKIRETLPIGDALPGMHLADALTDDAGRVLVPGGTALTESLLQSLVRRNIAELRIERDVEDDPVAAQARREKVEEMLDHRFRQAGDSPGAKLLYQAIFDFSLEHQA